MWLVFPHFSPLRRFPSFSSHQVYGAVSSSLNQSISRLKFYDLFDAALKEYNQKTGVDIVTDPLSARLLDCDSSDEVLDILQETSPCFQPVSEMEMRRFSS